MRIAITGGFGFVGGRIAEDLSDSKNEITLLSRDSRKIPSWLPNSKTAVIDWSNSEKIEKLLHGQELIIHAAGMNSQDCNSNPEAALNFNGFGTYRLVKAAKNVGVKKFVYVSTAHVYASPLQGLITEETITSNSHPYATSHLAGERHVLEANDKLDDRFEVVRLSNSFGVPSQIGSHSWDAVINDLCRQAVMTGEMLIHSNGLQKRDFIPIELATQILREHVFYSEKRRSSRIINISSGFSRSVIDVAHLISQICGEILGEVPTIRTNSVDPTSPNEFQIKSNFYKILNERDYFHTSIHRLIIFCRDNLKNFPIHE